jgi:hypothetical protein
MAGMCCSASPQPNRTRQRTRTGQYHLKFTGQGIQGFHTVSPRTQGQANPCQGLQGSVLALWALALQPLVTPSPGECSAHPTQSGTCKHIGRPMGAHRNPRKPDTHRQHQTHPSPTSPIGVRSKPPPAMQTRSRCGPMEKNETPAPGRRCETDWVPSPQRVAAFGSAPWSSATLHRPRAQPRQSPARPAAATTDTMDQNGQHHPGVAQDGPTRPNAHPAKQWPMCSKLRNKALFKGLACKATAAAIKMAAGNHNDLGQFHEAGPSNLGTHGR